LNSILDTALSIWREYPGTVVAGAVFLVFLVLFRKVLWPHSKPASFDARSDIERRFRNVFAMMGEDRRQGIIDYYSYKHDCGREEAMKLAMEDRARDEGRW